MNSRMDRYAGTKVLERTEKNKKLYEEVSSMNVDFIDINVNNAIEIGNIKDARNLTREEYQRSREINKILPAKEKSPIIIEEEEKKEERIYDINEILKLARENKLFENDEKKRLINTEYNILTKLDISQIDEKKTSSKENLRELIDAIYGNSEKEEENTQEGLLDNLLEDKVLSEDTSRDILDKGEEVSSTKELENFNEEVTKLLNIDEDDDEQEENKISLIAEKNEEEDSDEEDTDGFEIENEIKKSKVVLVLIIVFVVLLLSVCGYLFYKYFI